MHVIADYDNGDVLNSEVLSISPDLIFGNFANAALRVAAISLETGYATPVAVPHLVQNAFKNLAAIGLEVNYKFKEIANAGQAPAAAPAKVAAKEAPKPVVEEKPAEVEEDMDMGDLFG